MGARLRYREEGRGGQLLGPARVGQHLRRGVVDGMPPHTLLYTHALGNGRARRASRRSFQHTRRGMCPWSRTRAGACRGAAVAAWAEQHRAAEQSKNKAMKPGLCQNGMVTAPTAVACGGRALQHRWVPTQDPRTPKGRKGNRPATELQGAVLPMSVLTSSWSKKVESAYMNDARLELRALARPAA